MSDLFATEHVVTLAVIGVAVTAMVIAARRWPGQWLKALAVVLVVDEVSWWIYIAAGGGERGQRAQPLPLQLCDMAIFIAAVALWTRNQLVVEVTYFWALAGTIQALLTPDLPQRFPSYPYFQYYVAHGGVVGAALLLVIGLRLQPRASAVLRVAGLTVAYAALVGAVDLITGADYMFLRAKPASSTLLDLLGPWPAYILAAALIAVLLFAILDAPFRLSRLARSRQRRAEALR